MRASLNIWKSPNNTEHEMIECQELIIKDGPRIYLDGDERRLFHVIAADGIYHSVVSIEVL